MSRTTWVAAQIAAREIRAPFPQKCFKNKEAMMFEDIRKVRQRRKKYNAEMFRSGITTFNDLEELEANALRDGAIECKYKELIALGISISYGCYG